MEDFKLSTLLQWKRNEMPTEAFWTDFDAQLQQRLAAETMVAVPSWKAFAHRLVLRWAPLGVACALALSFSFDSTMKTSQRFVALHMPKSIEQCSTHYQDLGRDHSFIPGKNIIEKKNVASIAPRCFSF